ncbi:MAG: hypothetical protein HY735_36865, partial [Verrucomicrobia bacterium]|nr:hypothetical protein [Verrucomicrobiota bacterium]
MITEEPKLTVNAATTHRFLPLLLLLFVGSGCAALIYEIVWFQLLQLVIGSSAISLGVLLGTFMGGMCLGSLAFPRVISSGHHPLRVYGLIELGIGLLGVFVLFAMPYVGRLYMAYAGEGSMGILLRGIVCAVSLLPPTVLMGATLPAIARWVETSPQGISWLGFFYGGNIAGAVFGCLLAGFYLLRVHEMATATFVAAMINGVVGLIGLGLAALTSRDHAVADTSQPCRDLSSCESFIGNNRGSEAHTSKSEIQNPKSDIDQSLLTSAPTDGSSEPAPAEAPPTTPLKRGTGAEPGNTGPAPADTAVELSGALASRHLPLPARNEWGED